MLHYPWNSVGKNTGVGYHSLLQGIFPTQGSNPSLPHCKQILYHLSHQGSPPPSQTPALLSGFDFSGQGLWPLWSEEHPGWKMTLITELLHLCWSSIIEDYAKTLGAETSVPCSEIYPVIYCPPSPQKTSQGKEHGREGLVHRFLPPKR